MVFAYSPFTLENTVGLAANFLHDLRNSKKDQTSAVIKAIKLFTRFTCISVNLAGDAAAIGLIAVASLKAGPLERYKKMFQVTCVGSRAFLCLVSMIYSGFRLNRYDEFSLFHSFNDKLSHKGDC